MCVLFYKELMSTALYLFANNHVETYIFITPNILMQSDYGNMSYFENRFNTLSTALNANH